MDRPIELSSSPVSVNVVIRESLMPIVILKSVVKAGMLVMLSGSEVGIDIVEVAILMLEWCLFVSRGED